MQLGCQSLPFSGFHFFRNHQRAYDTVLVITGIAGLGQEHQIGVYTLKADWRGLRIELGGGLLQGGVLVSGEDIRKGNLVRHLTAE